MTFFLSSFLRFRPYLYHLTASENLPSIASSLQILCANAIFAEAGLAKQIPAKREAHTSIACKLGTVLIRDQKPLIEGAIQFEDGWDMNRFVHHVNQHVFFWPGTSVGPITPGRNHFERYRAENPVILRIATDQAATATLKFSRYNSGAPRCSGGKYSPRGSRTYLPPDEFFGTASEVVEVVARDAFALPISVEVSRSPFGPWRPLHDPP